MFNKFQTSFNDIEIPLRNLLGIKKTELKTSTCVEKLKEKGFHPYWGSDDQVHISYKDTDNKVWDFTFSNEAVPDFMTQVKWAIVNKKNEFPLRYNVLMFGESMIAATKVLIPEGCYSIA